MSFPIIHLSKTSLHNACLTDDPSKVHATLYTFLRSVPSETEVKLSMSEFERALHATDALLHRPSTKSVMLLESAIQDFLLRDPPYVESTRNIQSEGKPKGTRTSACGAPSVLAKDLDQGEQRRSRRSLHSEFSGHAPVGTEEDGEDRMLHIPVKSTKMFSDPFEAYEEYYQANCCRHSQDRSLSGVERIDEGELQEEAEDEPLEHGNDIDALGDRHKSVGVSGLSNTTPFTTPLPEQEVRLKNGSEEGRSGSFTASATASNSLSCERSLFSLMPLTDLSDYHPLLEALVQQVRSVLTANDHNKESHIHASFDKDDLKFHKTMLDVFAHIRERLQRSEEEVKRAADAYTERISIWDPSHSYYKESLRFVQQLSERARAAEDLYTVERSEQETIRIAHCALLAEVITMRLLLRDVKQVMREAATEDSQSDIDNDVGAAQTRRQLIDELRDVFSLGSTTPETIE